VRIEKRLAELGLVLPDRMQLPPGVKLPFPWVRVHGDRAFVSGHGPLNADGSLADFCANGTRCAARLKARVGLVRALAVAGV